MLYYVNNFFAPFDVNLLFPIVIYGKFASTRDHFLQKNSAQAKRRT